MLFVVAAMAATFILVPRGFRYAACCCLCVAQATHYDFFTNSPAAPRFEGCWGACSAGEIDIQSDHMSWNTTKGTYQLNLLARIPINNPNFLNVRRTAVDALLSLLAIPLHACSRMHSIFRACLHASFSGHGQHPSKA